MDKITTILVPFDSSDFSKTALEYAVEFTGKDDPIELLLVSVADGNSLTGIESAFEVAKKKYADRLKTPLQWVSGKGQLTDTLMKIRDEKKADLVIMGTSGLSGDPYKEHSKTSKFVLEARCPVIVVPPDAGEFQIKNIAMVLGKEEIDDRQALETLLEVSRRFAAKVHVLTIENSPELYGYGSSDEKNENLLAYYLEHFYSEHTFIENDDVVQGILAYSASKEFDLIAILPRNHTKKSDPSEGRLTQMLTLESKIPILAID
ncbi:MAG TPA: universal stress protein [Eudoraea sp.]|nr:universal stress protein [Eudoraea sp.]